MDAFVCSAAHYSHLTVSATFAGHAGSTVALTMIRGDQKVIGIFRSVPNSDVLRLENGNADAL